MARNPRRASNCRQRHRYRALACASPKQRVPPGAWKTKSDDGFFKSPTEKHDKNTHAKVITDFYALPGAGNATVCDPMASEGRHQIVGMDLDPHIEWIAPLQHGKA
jgi:hypothetical protein